MNDKNYIKGLLNHDSKILSAIYQNFAPRIQQHVVGKGGTVEDARDVFQDALMIIYNKAKQPDFELTSQFYTYLFGICRFIWDRKRKKKANNTVTIPEDNRYKSDSNIEQDIINRERHKIFQDNFSKLGTFCQQLLDLFHQKKNMIEIANQLNLKNAHTTRTRKYRCQKKLEDLIKSDQRFNVFKVHKKKI